MVLHPTIHLEIARQRQCELLAAAERQRIAEAIERVGAAPAGSASRVERVRRRDPH